MAQNITLLGASYSDVPSVTLPKTGGGTASFTDVTDTTAVASDVATGKYFYLANGTRTVGTSSGGGQGGAYQDENGYIVLNDDDGGIAAIPLSVTENGTYAASAGQAYSPVTVNVSGSSPTIQSLTVTPTTSQQTYNSSSVDGYKPVVVNAMPSGSVTAPATISGTSATVSTGTNTLTLSKTVSVTPSVTTAGYVSSGTARNSSVSLTASVTTQGAQTIYPASTDQTITGSKYLTGTQTIKAVTTSNLTAANIKSGVTVTVGDSADADRILSVTGTYEGSGGGDVTYGSFSARAVDSTAVSYVAIIATAKRSDFAYPVPMLAKLSSATTLGYKWVKSADGYLYIGLRASSNYYTPSVTATSGTATLLGTYSNGDTFQGSDVSYNLDGATVFYKVSDNAVLSVSYYNNN